MVRKEKQEREGEEEAKSGEERNSGMNPNSDFSLLDYLRKVTELAEAQFTHLSNRHNYTHFINKPNGVF